jgi:hypothetical protein
MTEIDQINNQLIKELEELVAMQKEYIKYLESKVLIGA